MFLLTKTYLFTRALFGSKVKNRTYAVPEKDSLLKKFELSKNKLYFRY